MALITCPECGNAVSDKSASCIHCGFPISAYINVEPQPAEDNFTPYTPRRTASAPKHVQKPTHSKPASRPIIQRRKKKNHKKLILTGVVVLAVILAIKLIIGIATVGDGREKQESSAKDDRVFSSDKSYPWNDVPWYQSYEPLLTLYKKANISEDDSEELIDSVLNSNIIVVNAPEKLNISDHIDPRNTYGNVFEDMKRQGLLVSYYCRENKNCSYVLVAIKDPNYSSDYDTILTLIEFVINQETRNLSLNSYVSVSESSAYTDSFDSSIFSKYPYFREFATHEQAVYYFTETLNSSLFGLAGEYSLMNGEAPVDLKLSNLPYLSNFESELSKVLSAIYEGTNYSYQNCGIHRSSLDTTYSLSDGILVINYGPNGNVLLNADIEDGIVRSITSTVKLGEYYQIDMSDAFYLASELAIAPAVLFFEGDNYSAIAGQLLEDMPNSGLEKYNESLLYDRLQYEEAGLKITLEFLYEAQGDNGADAISLNVSVSEELIAKEKKSQAYLDAQESFADVDSTNNTAQTTNSSSWGIENSEENTYLIEATGVIQPSSYVIDGWELVLSVPVTVEDWNGKQECYAFYFYPDNTIGGNSPAVFSGKTVTVSGTPENYRDAGYFFLYSPTLVKLHDDSSNAITKGNFESVVDLTPRDNHSKGLFEIYFNEQSGSNSWEYLGTSYSTFSLPEYDFYSFDIYQMNSEYYLIPFNDYTISPTIYKFVENEEPILVWSYAV